ncbi:MAG: ATP-binding cassette domain-containing protein [Alphaproteobacteria bacterium]|nr:ATP-binding cassette domain-containing protein [Alphaproteobacteria bacterium]
MTASAPPSPETAAPARPDGVAEVADLSTGSLVGRLVRESMRPHAARVAVAFVCMALVALSTAAMAKVMEPIIDEVFTARDSSMLWPVAGAVFVIFLVKGLATYGQAVLMNDVGRKVVADLQARMFDRLVRADLADFQVTPAGTLVSRFVYDTQLLFNAVANAITGMGKDALTLIALGGVMLSLDWKLALFALVLFPIAVIPIAKLGRRMRKVTRSTQDDFGLLSNRLTEVFQGIRHVKADNAEARESRRATDLIDRLAWLQRKAARIKSASHPIMENLAGLAIVGIILYGGNEVIAGNRTAGSFFAFITALLLAYEPAKKLANMNATLQQGLAAAQRVFGVVDAEPSVVDRPDATPLGRVRGHVRLDGVRFAYAADAPALDAIDLDVPAGRSVALVGPSGAGKSTVLNLIPRFYDVDAGRVTVDGVDVRDATLASLRANIALVSQEIVLFDDTVRANIAYSRPGATAEEVEAAARAAAAHEFIQALPQGYDTMIGDRGTRLSGGQRQRLSIARAMLKDAPILLMDEATSALDTESERLVQQALDRLMTGRTTLVIAHRLSTVMGADRIHVLDAGRIVESGSHAELIARGGLYARLWALQTTDTRPPRAVVAGA